jgi:predicted ATPase/DNA-binding CsgD family transcriptional regulator
MAVEYALGGLPSPVSRFIGRERQLEEVAPLIGTSRLVTLTGAGGSGKTRLALEIAGRLRHTFRDGAIFVPLGPVSEPCRVPNAVAQALGIRESPGRTASESVVLALRGQHLLLVLDNLEHLIEAATVVGEWLPACPQLTILATSRERLRLQAERVYPVPPLSLDAPADGRSHGGSGGHPDTPIEPDGRPVDAASEALRLFVDRARAVQQGFALTEDLAPVIGEICRRLDGLPLAIELVAAQLRVLPPTALLDRLERRLPLLSLGPRDAPARQRTLHDTIAWSYDLLTENERSLFRRLAVFVDGWTLEGAEAVCTTGAGSETGWPREAGPSSPVDAPPTLVDLLASLVDKSLVLRVGSATSEPRFGMLQTIREYGAERLTGHGEEAIARQAHAGHYLRLVESAAPLLHGPDQIVWLDRLDEEHANLRAALSRCLDTRDAEAGLRLAATLHWFWFVRGHLGEGRAWLERALGAAGWDEVSPDEEVSVPPALLARGLYGAGQLALFQGDFVAARVRLTQSASLFRRLGDHGGLLHALTFLGAVASHHGDRSTQGAVVDELLALVPTLEGTWDGAALLFNWGRTALLWWRDSEAARARLESSLDQFRAFGDTWYVAMIASDLGGIALMDGDLTAAQAHYEEALALARALKDPLLIATTLNELGEVARARGDLESAATAYAESLRRYERLGQQQGVPRLLHNLGYVALHQGDLDGASAHFGASLDRFRALGVERGVAEALAGLAAVAAARGEAERAARLWGAAEVLHETLDTHPWPADRREYDRTLPLARAALDAPSFTAAWAEGRAITPEAAITEATTPQAPTAVSVPAAPSESDDRTTRPGGLSRREVDVARLVAAGKTNREIAQALGVGERTVSTHLDHIFGKLNVSSRTAVATFALWHGLA